MTPEQRNADDLAALKEIPAVRIMHTGRAISAAAHAQNAVQVQSLLHGLASRGMLRAAMRSWALIIAELGPPRLPGGALVEGVEDMRVRSNRRPRPAGAAGEPQWLAQFRTAMDAARDRDGAGLFASIDRAFEPGTPGLLNYAASYATSAHHLIDITSARPGTVAALHLLGHAGVTSAQWSTCGPLYRLVAALLAVIDMGGAGAEAIEPELATIAELPDEGMLDAFSAISAVAAVVAGGNPHEPLDAALHIITPEGATVPDENVQPEQAKALRVADGMVRALRDQRGMEYFDSLDGSEVALGVYGCANLFATRVYRLWGA